MHKTGFATWRLALSVASAAGATPTQDLSKAMIQGDSASRKTAMRWS